MAITIPIISEYDGKGVKKAIAEFKQLETTGEKAQFALKKAALPAAAAVGALTVAMGDAVKAAIDDEKSQQMLARQLKATTGATDDQIKSVEKYISAQGRNLGITDDQLRPALAGLVRATPTATPLPPNTTARPTVKPTMTTTPRPLRALPTPDYAATLKALNAATASP